MLGRRIVKRDRPAAPEKTHLSALMRTAWMSRSGVFRRADAFGEMFYGGKSDSRLHFPCCIRMLEFVFFFGVMEGGSCDFCNIEKKKREFFIKLLEKVAYVCYCGL